MFLFSTVLKRVLNDEIRLKQRCQLGTQIVTEISKVFRSVFEPTEDLPCWTEWAVTRGLNGRVVLPEQTFASSPADMGNLSKKKELATSWWATSLVFLRCLCIILCTSCCKSLSFSTSSRRGGWCAKAGLRRRYRAFEPGSEREISIWKSVQALSVSRILSTKFTIDL